MESKPPRLVHNVAPAQWRRPATVCLTAHPIRLQKILQKCNSTVDLIIQCSLTLLDSFKFLKNIGPYYKREV